MAGNKPPVAADDAVSVLAHGSVVIRPLFNDRDPNNNRLRVTRISKSRHGRAVLNSDGTVTYAPNQAYEGGTDSFEYWVSDGHRGTAHATVTVTVNPTAAATAGGSSTGTLATTGLNVVAVLGAGIVAVLVGGVLYLGTLRGGRTAAPALALHRTAAGRHRPGRHRG